jgi:hypothetical protein
MHLLARAIEHPLDVPIERPQRADARHHGRAACRTVSLHAHGLLETPQVVSAGSTFLLAAFDIRCARIARPAGPSSRQRFALIFVSHRTSPGHQSNCTLAQFRFLKSHGFQANIDQMLTLVVIREIPNRRFIIILPLPSVRAPPGILRSRSRQAHADKSQSGGQRNLTVAALELLDGSIAVEARAEARSTQASSSVGLGHA